MSYLGSNQTLSAGATYTSATKRTDWYDHIRGTVNSTQDGNFYIEQSWDETAETSPSTAIWGYSKYIAVTSAGSATSTVNTGTSSKGFTFDENVVAPFWRVRFINNGASAASIRVHAKLTTEGNN
jgi:hypothetical protein